MKEVGISEFKNGKPERNTWQIVAAINCYNGNIVSELFEIFWKRI